MVKPTQTHCDADKRNDYPMHYGGNKFLGVESNKTPHGWTLDNIKNSSRKEKELLPK